MIAVLIEAMRPRQWVKNLLVAAVPVAAGQIGQPPVLAATAVAFVAFTLAAGGIYLINDVRDRAEDRHDPVKCRRPVASGRLAPRTAVWAGGLLLAAAPVPALTAGSPGLAAILLVYIGLSLAYCFWLRDQPVIDLGIIASGFLLRAMAGGAATGLPMSVWFLLVASFGSLFVAAGKRYSEIRLTEQAPSQTRRSLREYSGSYLRFVWSLSAALVITAYGLWAFEMYAATGQIWAPISLVPFVFGILRYALDVDRGTAGTPEDIVFRDRMLHGCAAAWLILIGIDVAGRS